jgi:hypothetical protein
MCESSLNVSFDVHPTHCPGSCFGERTCSHLKLHVTVSGSLHSIRCNADLAHISAAAQHHLAVITRVTRKWCMTSDSCRKSMSKYVWLKAPRGGRKLPIPTYSTSLARPLGTNSAYHQPTWRPLERQCGVVLTGHVVCSCTGGKRLNEQNKRIGTYPDSFPKASC